MRRRSFPGSWVLVVLAACDAPAPEESPDAATTWQPQPPPPGERVTCTENLDVPVACERPAGVTWADSTSYASQTLAWPAGVVIENASGCIWVVVKSDGAGGVAVDARVLGCHWALRAPTSLACTECGTCSGSGIADDALGFQIEGCTPSGRGNAWSGGIGLYLDRESETVTVTPPFADTSSSPFVCACQ